MAGHTLVHACAGAGKTERIVRRCAESERKRLVITLTDTGQEELLSRLSKACGPAQTPDVMGWYAFLINHYIRPYLPSLFPGVRPTGFLFDRKFHPDNHYRLAGSHRYFSADGSLYRQTLAELAVKVARSSSGLPEARLGRIYDEIIFDEVQDLSRKSLDIIARLLEQVSPEVFMVGDTRQSLLDSDQMSRKNQAADRLGLLKWYETHEAEGRLAIEHDTVTWRSNQAIADFSDRIFPANLGFPATVSKNMQVTGHDGVFLVSETYLEEYLETYDPVLLRAGKSSGKHLDDLNFKNFGKTKGQTFDRVLVYPTEPMLKFIEKGEPLKEKSACAFYVGITRARFSVGIIVKDGMLRKLTRGATYIPIDVWSPQESA